VSAGLEGRVALVTGGSRGIGLGIADALLAAGARVCITGRTQADLDEVVAERDPEGAHDRVMAVAGRTDDGLHREGAVEAVLSRWGRLDALVNNAATNPQHGPLVDADLEAVRKVLAVNLVAPLGWVQAAWRGWMAEHGGAVLNVASIGGIRAGADIGAYNASKAGLIHLTRQLALELAPGVRVNAIAPAVVKTRFAEALYLDREDEVAAGYPLRRLGTPEDTAGIARFLLSDEAAWITGETVVVDGGVSLVGRA
jgi:NAD(P)-dependent dehydrogenase (short-subunit alcohol dehydrogenase family)